MTGNKRFRVVNHDEFDYELDYIMDNYERMHISDVCDLLNNFNEENEQLKQELTEQVSRKDACLKTAHSFKVENERLKECIKSLEKQCYLIHMQSMFSTVKSFKGDISKRYKYSEETDTIYDTANHYGQYHKILDKKEVTMLLNEYNTLLEESNEK